MMEERDKKIGRFTRPTSRLFQITNWNCSIHFTSTQSIWTISIVSLGTIVFQKPT